MSWEALRERERSRYADGLARLDPEQLVRLGNAAYGAGLCALMLGCEPEASVWLRRAAARWRESWEHASPDAWGRPVGIVKAALISGNRPDATRYARWTLGLGSAEGDSPIGRYAQVLALLSLRRWADAKPAAAVLAARSDFPAAVADALTLIGAGDRLGTEAALESVLVSFETRTAYLEDVPVADTVLALARLALLRGIDLELRPSAMLPAPRSSGS